MLQACNNIETEDFKRRSSMATSLVAEVIAAFGWEREKMDEWKLLLLACKALMVESGGKGRHRRHLWQNFRDLGQFGSVVNNTILIFKQYYTYLYTFFIYIYFKKIQKTIHKLLHETGFSSFCRQLYE